MTILKAYDIILIGGNQMTKTIYALDSVINFGQYKKYGYTISEILDIDPDYLEWCLDNVEWFALSQEALDILRDILNDVQDYDPYDNEGMFDEQPF